MKKILLILFGVLFVSGAYSAQIANVEYVHKMIEQTWDITVPYNDALNSVKQISNMKYLLSAIDVANHMLNGSATTNYGNGEFATLQIADTDTVNTAVETLIVGDGTSERNYKFFITTTSNTTSFYFSISAAGEFYVDWGDGTRNKITRTNTQELGYRHGYSTAGTYTIKIGGKATAYNTNENTAAIDFSKVSYNSNRILSIDGSLGAIFGTLADGTQPRFYDTFYGASNMTGSIPENLFAGISGAPASNMFYRTFYNCKSLTGPSARINGQYLYEIWPDATWSQVGDMYSGATGLSDYIHIPVAWGGFGVTTNEYPSAPSDAVYDFYLTTTSDTNVFAMQISAAGEFYIDWGDGKSEWITKSDTTNMTFGHKYASKDVYNIRLGGQATAYNTSTSTAAISFYVNSARQKIASIDGSLGAIFGTLSSDTNNQPRFYQTFYYATNMSGAIPENLFAGISGAPASNMFQSTFSGCSGLTGAIPDGLFAGISGAPASNMFESTFKDCSGLTSIPENLFGNISGTAQSNMFYRTFYDCTSLTGPSARINGQYLYEIWPDATSSQVGDMYKNATGLSDYACIPTVWGGGGEDCSAPTAEFTLTTTSTNSFSFSISAAGEFVVDWGDGKTETITKPDTTNTIYSHDYDTAGTYTIGLSGQATGYNTNTSTAAISFEPSSYRIASIDGSLGAIFGTLSSDTNNQPRFYMTFFDASNMTGSIPANLFTGISGAPANNMFYGTFYECSGLTGAIPDGLFGNLTGAPAEYMFSGTFYECSGLTGAIPDGLFGDLTGAPAYGMFDSTFDGCSGLTGAIPDGLFGNLSGAPASNMFESTFKDCSGLTSIPENLFGGISGPAQSYMFSRTFSYCTSLTGPSARINGQYLYEIWPDATSSQVGGMYSGATGLSDYACIPTVWGGGGEDCSAPTATAEFTLTTTDDTSSFSFSISAAGKFYVDWGDGTVETITKPDTTDTIYSHDYDTTGAYTIGIGGQATAYNTDRSKAAISFYVNSSQTKIASIDGSLGAIFGTLPDVTENQPRFYNTFYNATNMKGAIPSDLFAGISGAPVEAMFYSTFLGCSGLTGAIPDGLFAGISGAPASYMFAYTFYGCSGLTGAIPDGLFGNLTGAPAEGMFLSTFSGCSGLTSIPENLFGNISGTAQSGMFSSTFSDCTSLTGPSARINGQYLYEIWPSVSGAYVSNMYAGCTGLSDYSSISYPWKPDDNEPLPL